MLQFLLFGIILIISTFRNNVSGVKMDIQLQELIDKIKKDGVATAEEQASRIIEDAEKKAAAVIEEAGKKADDLLKNSKAEIERLEKASEDAVTQACRNMLLSFRESLVSELDAFVQSECAKAYSSDMLKSLIPETVKAWCKNTDASELSVLLSEKDCSKLEGEFKAALKAELSKGMELKADKSLAAGFRIGVNNGAAYYDYSAEAIADLFTAYLNPRVAAIMKNAAKGND